MDTIAIWPFAGKRSAGQLFGVLRNAGDPLGDLNAETGTLSIAPLAVLVRMVCEGLRACADGSESEIIRQALRG